VRPLIVAAPASGCGKSSVTLGLLGALRRRGLQVAPFKVGPDFIDPGHHAAVCGRPSYNLDSWMCGQAGVLHTFTSGINGSDLALVEGVMGLFDGADGATDAGSTAEIARWLGGSILLVVDARAQARSATAVVKGFTTFAPELDFAGVLYNRVGSANHAELLREAHASVPELPPLLGCLARDAELTLPERHLGLVTAGETAATLYARLADRVTAQVDLDRLLAALDNGRPPQAATSPVPTVPTGAAVRIGVGAELVFFSPLTDALPAGLDGLYLPGGYPELYTLPLAANRPLLTTLRREAAQGLPVYAECGGLLYLCAGLTESRAALAGLFPARPRLLPALRALGYREVTFATDTPLGPAGTVARGHEFHYSTLTMPEQVRRSYRVTDRRGRPCPAEGYLQGNVLGSYVHLHFASNPQLAANFVAAGRRWRQTAVP
jgi:cobyrinic acid a,c-diamide synthase